jgi:shikimate dehydrogenase
MTDCTTSIDRYAVLGHPIQHSMSPSIHAAFALQTGQRLTYEAMDVAPDQLVTRLSALPSEGFRGVNITVPHKEAVWTFTKEHGHLSQRAALAGAVNTLAWTETGLLGDNTDGQGLLNDLQQRHGLSLKGKRLLLLGAGGATRGVILPLLSTHPSALIIANRTAERAKAVAQLFAVAAQRSNCHIAGCGLNAFTRDIDLSDFDLVINATSASLHGEVITLPASTLSPGAFAYDMMYGKNLTPFLAAQQAAGIKHLADGLGMLVEQAAVAFSLWRGVTPETTPVYNALREKLVRN